MSLCYMDKFIVTILFFFIFTNVLVKYINFTFPDRFKVFFQKNFPVILDMVILILAAQVFFSMTNVDLDINGTPHLEKVIHVSGNTLF